MGRISSSQGKERLPDSRKPGRFPESKARRGRKKQAYGRGRAGHIKSASAYSASKMSPSESLRFLILMRTLRLVQEMAMPS